MKGVELKLLFIGKFLEDTVPENGPDPIWAIREDITDDSSAHVSGQGSSTGHAQSPTPNS